MYNQAVERKRGYTTSSRMWIILVSVFLVFGILIWWMGELYKERLVKETYNDAAIELASNTSSLSLSMNRRLLLMEGLKAFVEAELVMNQSIGKEHFDSFASNFMKNISGVRNFSVYPDGIATYVYPLEGNEELLNLDIFTHPNPEIRENAERTMKTQNITIVGPFELIQGGLGIVARQSVFSDDQFWGFVSVVLDFSPILQEAGVLRENLGIDIALRVNGEVAFGSPEIFTAENLLEQVFLPEGIWEVVAVPTKEKVSLIQTKTWTARIIALFGLMMLMYFLYLQMTQKTKLHLLVQERTENLLLANQQLAKKEQALRYMAYHDSVTGLHNRDFFHEQLNELLTLSKQTGHSFAVLFFDMDHFKLINDSLGHSMGDLLLREVGQRLSATLTNNEIISRIGGDEFTIIFPYIEDSRQVQHAAEQVLGIFQEPFILNDTEHFVTSSSGIAVYPDHGEDFLTLIKNADTAMYRAKEAGKNNYRVYEPTMNQDACEKVKIKNNLSRALARNEFEIYYQPQVEVQSGQIVGLEALIRWQHPKLGMVPPDTFISVAEETGLIVPIGEWVLRTACAQISAWQAAGLPPVRIAVNLSARQIQENNLVENIKQILIETALDPTYLELEITEKTAMQDANLTKLNEIRNMGITLSIDDFGTHYSSLSYLKHLPVNKIKIDRSFVTGICTGHKDKAIIKAILLVARHLNLSVVAEGVETKEQYTFLKRNRCKEVQGFLFNRPMPATLIEQTLLNHDPKAVLSST